MNSFMSIVLKQIGMNSQLRALFTSPSLGLPISKVDKSDFLSKLNKFGALKVIPIFTTKITENGENSIGKQVLLRADKEGTDVITDNVAPQPRVWEIQGYISSGALTLGINSGSLALLSKYSQPIIMKLIKDYIRYLRNSRAPFSFTTNEGETVDALIVNYNFTDVPDVENATGISLRIMEYAVLAIDKDTYALRNAPATGSSFGSPSSWTNTIARSVDSSLGLLVAVASKKKEPKSEKEKGSVEEQDQAYSDEEYLNDLGADLTVIKALFDDSRSSFVVAETPFIDLQTADDTYAGSKTITFENNSVTFTLRKDVASESRDWWLTEEGVVNNTPINYTTKFGVDSFKHYSGSFTYIIVSPFKWKDDFTPDQERTWIANSSLLIKY